MDRPLEIEDEWRNFELYEKVRVRENRKRFILISLAILTFLGLCSVPVFEERMPKWRSLQAASQISVLLEKLKTLSIQEKKPVRLRFLDKGQYVVEVLTQCNSETALRIAKEGTWSDADGALKVLDGFEAKKLSLKLAFDQVCFDPVMGLDGVKSKRVLVIAPVKDLAEQRLDRASYVILEGESAKISIN